MTNEEFRADDEFAFHMSFLPEQIASAPPRWFQYWVRDDILGQLNAHLNAIDRQFPDDLWLPIRVAQRAERIVGAYIEAGLDLLVEFREEIRLPLNVRWRMRRRKIYAAGFKCPAHEYPRFQKIMRQPWFDQSPYGLPTDAAEDLEAAEAHVVHGTPLMAGLRQAALAKKAQAIAAWNKSRKLTGEFEANGEVALEAALQPSNGLREHDAEVVHGPRGPPGGPSRVQGGTA
jgi:hypothetical protein